MRRSEEKEMQFVEWYAKHVWPFHRMFLGKTLEKRCTRCTNPEKYSPLKDGLCEICRSNKPTFIGPSPERKKEMAKEVNAIFERYQDERTLQFDCVVLFSGGKDSTYMLHTLKSRYPCLRILALIVDNTFLTKTALENANRVVNKLGVSYMILRADPKLYEKVFRHAFLNLNGRMSSAVVDQCDGDILHDTGRNVAVRYNIPIVVSGIQAVQVEQYLGLKNFESEQSFNESKRTEMAGFPLESFLNEEERAYFWDGTKWPKERIPRMIFPYYAWDYSENEVLNTIEKLGLLQRKKVSPLATNHKLIPLMGAVDIARFGYSSYDPEIADDIRAGLADKKYWQAILEMQEYAMKKNRFVGNSLNEVMGRLHLTRKDLGLK